MVEIYETLCLKREIARIILYFVTKSKRSVKMGFQTLNYKYLQLFTFAEGIHYIVFMFVNDNTWLCMKHVPKH